MMVFGLSRLSSENVASEDAFCPRDSSGEVASEDSFCPHDSSGEVASEDAFCPRDSSGDEDGEKRARKSSSDNTGIPNSRAFLFLPDEDVTSLLIRKSVDFDTLPVTSGFLVFTR